MSWPSIGVFPVPVKTPPVVRSVVVAHAVMFGRWSLVVAPVVLAVALQTVRRAMRPSVLGQRGDAGQAAERGGN
jgi:hypothetical protein